MGTPLGPKYIPYTYMDPLGKGLVKGLGFHSGIVTYLEGQGYRRSMLKIPDLLLRNLI